MLKPKVQQDRADRADPLWNSGAGSPRWPSFSVVWFFRRQHEPGRQWLNLGQRPRMLVNLCQAWLLSGSWPYLSLPKTTQWLQDVVLCVNPISSSVPYPWSPGAPAVTWPYCVQLLFLLDHAVFGSIWYQSISVGQFSCGYLCTHIPCPAGCYHQATKEAEQTQTPPEKKKVIKPEPQPTATVQFVPLPLETTFEVQLGHHQHGMAVPAGEKD